MGQELWVMHTNSNHRKLLVWKPAIENCVLMAVHFSRVVRAPVAKVAMK